MSHHHRNAWEAAEMWLAGGLTRRIVLAPRLDPPGFEVELHDGEHVTYGDELELVHALAEAFDRRGRERADTEPPDTIRDALVDDSEPMLSSERDNREPEVMP